MKARAEMCELSELSELSLLPKLCHTELMSDVANRF
jgi:hypothetical protein